MSRFEPVLRALAAQLELPQPERARILEEIAGDLDDLRVELIRRGFGAAEAEARSVEMLVPSDPAVLALVRMHEPLYRSLARRFSTGGMRQTERIGLLLVSVVALVSMTAPLLGSGLLSSPSAFFWPIPALVTAVVVIAGRKAFQLFVLKDHERTSLRTGMGLLLSASGLAVAFSLAGLLFDLYRLAAALEISPVRPGLLIVPWLLDACVLLSAGLLTALFGGLCWFLLLQKITSVEQAHLHESRLLGIYPTPSLSLERI